jgi:hypothetical protein
MVVSQLITYFVTFNGQGSVQRKYITFDIFPTRFNITKLIYFWKTALDVSGGIPTHHWEHTHLYSQNLVVVKPLLLTVAIVEELEMLAPIIRSTHNCIYRIWYLSNRYRYLPLSWKSWNWLHPSSGAHITVFTVSGTCQTVTTTCRYRGRVGSACTHHQEHTQLYLQYLVLVKPLLLPAARWKIWNWKPFPTLP